MGHDVLYTSSIDVQVCQLEEGYATLATCSWCQLHVHLHCHEPVLKTKPASSCRWYCSGCEPIVRKRASARCLLARSALRSMNGAAQQGTPTLTGSKSNRACDMEALLAGGAAVKREGAGSIRGAGSTSAKVKVCCLVVWSVFAFFLLRQIRFLHFLKIRTAHGFI